MIKPRSYDLSQSQEAWRLLRELRGYIHTCHDVHHGTDLAGRQFALEALNEILGGGFDVSIRKSV